MKDRWLDWWGKYSDEVPKYLVVVAMGVFGLLRVWYNLPRFSDGNSYTYMGQVIAEGGLPYGDFFYSSPPLIPYFFALVGAIFGFSWQVFGLLPAMLTIIDALIIYLLVGGKWSKWAGVVSVIGYLFSFTVLGTTDFASDIHILTTLILLTVWALELKRPLVSGILLGLAVLGKLYAVIPAVAIGGWLLATRQGKSLGWVVGSSLGLVVAVMLGWWLKFREVLVDQLFVSHLGEIEGLSRLNIWKFFVTHDVVMAAGMVLVLYMLGRYWRRAPGQMVGLFMMMVIFLGWYQDIYFLYFKLLMAWMVILLGWAVWELEKILPKKYFGLVMMVLVVGLSGPSAWRYLSEQAEMAVVDGLDEMVMEVQEQIDEREVLYGDMEVAPLLAVSAGRKLYGHWADTNIKFYQTGYFDIVERAEELKSSQVRWLITKAAVNPYGQVLVGSVSAVPLEFLSDYCRVAKKFTITRDYSHNAVVLWKCEY